MTLAETQQSIDTRRQQIVSAQEQVQSFDPRIERTQKMLRQGVGEMSARTTQLRVTAIETQRQEAKEQALGEVGQALQEQQQIEQEFEDYKGSTTGRIQAAQEAGKLRLKEVNTLYSDGTKRETGYQYINTETDEVIAQGSYDNYGAYENIQAGANRAIEKYNAGKSKEYNALKEFEASQLVAPGANFSGKDGKQYTVSYSTVPGTVTTQETKTYPTIMQPQSTGYLDDTSRSLTTDIQKYRSKVSRGEELTAGESFKYTGKTLTRIGFDTVRTLRDAGKYGVNLFVKPEETKKKTVEFIQALPTAIKERGQNFGFVLKNYPEEAVAVTASYFAPTIAGKIGVRVSDTIRTVGLEELPTRSVVAPEFFAGQTYPAIRRGQSAGSLLSEFKARLPGEIKPAGYTASPAPFKSSTIASKGSSELPGVYQAPLLSPQFLRVSGETKSLFGFNPIGTLRPTAMRITPEEFRLVPGVYSRQRNLASVGKAKAFFADGAQTGKSYIPFIKTEKEAIIPAGTNLEQTGRRYFFSFENRKIPVLEFKTTGGKATGAGSAEELSSKYRTQLREAPLATPYTSLGTTAPSPSSVTSSEALGSKPSSIVKPSIMKSSPSISNPENISSSQVPRSSYDPYSISAPIIRSSDSFASEGSNIRGRVPSSSSPPVSRSGIRSPPSSVRGSSSTGSSSKGSSNTSYTSTTYYRKRDGASSNKRGETVKPFSLFARRFGTFKSVGSFRTLGEAEEAGLDIVKQNLGRSFQIKRGSQKIATPIRAGFRAPRAGGSIRIQQSRTSLSSRGEISEIIAARRRSKRGF